MRHRNLAVFLALAFVLVCAAGQADAKKAPKPKLPKSFDAVLLSLDYQNGSATVQLNGQTVTLIGNEKTIVVKDGRADLEDLCVGDTVHLTGKWVGQDLFLVKVAQVKQSSCRTLRLLSCSVNLDTRTVTGYDIQGNSVTFVAAPDAALTVTLDEAPASFASLQPLMPMEVKGGGDPFTADQICAYTTENNSFTGAGTLTGVQLLPGGAALLTVRVQEQGRQLQVRAVVVPCVPVTRNGLQTSAASLMVGDAVTARVLDMGDDDRRADNLPAVVLELAATGP